MDNALNEFLDQSYFCDCKNDLIRSTALKVVEGAETEKEKAMKIFYWVRDGILYQLGNWQCTATETMSKGFGTCTNSANLFVALCRSVNIPAGFGVQTVKASYFGPVAIPILQRHISKISTHIYAVVNLDGRWIKVDPSDDYELCANSYRINPTAKMINWDGETDAMLNIEQDDILEDRCPIPSIEDFMRKKSNKQIRTQIANEFVIFLREHSKSVPTTEALQGYFMRHLIKKKPLNGIILLALYCDYKMSGFVKKVGALM